MDNYRSEWVLATLKRKFIEISRSKDHTEIYYTSEMAKAALEIIAEIEANSVLGTPEMVTELVDNLTKNLDCGLPGGDTEECEDCKIDLEALMEEVESAKQPRNRICKDAKKIAIQSDALKSAIEEKHKSLNNASKILGRGHSYLLTVFRKYKVNFPVEKLEEIKNGLGVDYEPFRKRRLSADDAEREVN